MGFFKGIPSSACPRIEGRDPRGDEGRSMNANLRNFALWVIIVLLLLALFTLFQNPGQRASSQDITFSQLLTEVDQNHVRDVVIQGPEIHGTFTNGSSFQTYAPNDPTLVSRLYNGKVSITAKPPGDNVPWFVSLLVSWLPFIALIGVWIFLSRQMQGGAGKAMGFGKSRAKMLTEAHGRVTFEDVAGVDEAKQDLQEIVEFLRDPGKYQRLGGRIPRGVLLGGPPGTGKTLITGRGADSRGRSAGRPPRHRQDADRARGRGRGQRSLLHDLGFGLRRDVRRRRRLPSQGYVRTGQEERALHHLHRRNRRGRPASRRGSGRRQ